MPLGALPSSSYQHSVVDLKYIPTLERDGCLLHPCSQPAGGQEGRGWEPVGNLAGPAVPLTWHILCGHSAYEGIVSKLASML